MTQLSLSWSQLRNWEECKQKHHLMKSGHRSPAQDIRGYFHGTVVDRVMRDWLSADGLVAGEMVTRVEDIMEREEQAALDSGDGVVRWKHREDRAEVLAFCRELVFRLEPILNEFVLPFEYEPAKRFKTVLEIPYLDGRPVPIFLIGEMDLLVRNQSGDFLVWDLKGTKDDNYWRKTIGQLVFYDLSTFAMFGQYSNGGGLIQPMCKQQVLPMTVSTQQRAEMMQRIVAMAHALWRKDYALRDDIKLCGYCPVRHACPRFTPVGDVGKRRMVLGGMQAIDSV